MDTPGGGVSGTSERASRGGPPRRPRFELASLYGIEPGKQASMTDPAETIDGLIGKLDQIVDWSYTTKSRLRYFAALYRKVTIKVKEGIAKDFFDDGERMERLDVIFANRYLAAFEVCRNNGQPTRCWSYAFRVTKQWWPIVLQHLLLGMNAHINLDLGIAAARAVPSAALPSLREDFNRINVILAGPDWWATCKLSWRRSGRRCAS